MVKAPRTVGLLGLNIMRRAISFLKRLLGGDPPRFAEWKRVVSGIGHPEFPFLSKTYWPGARVPCRGFVEWIAEAWQAGDLDSVSRLLCEIPRANPGIGADGDAVMRAVGRLPYSLRKVDLKGTITGLNDWRLALLLSAFMLLEAIHGLTGEFIIVRPGKYFLSAAILPWDFEIPVAEQCVKHLNDYICRMREHTPILEEEPLCRAAELRPFDTRELERIRSLLERLAGLSVSAREAILAASSLAASGLLDDPFEKWAGGKYGGYTPDVGNELLQSRLIAEGIPADTPVERLEKRFTDEDLREALGEKGVPFRRSAKRDELLALARFHAADVLLAQLASGQKCMTLESQLVANARTLREFHEHQARRLGAWAAGLLVPRLAQVDGQSSTL